MRLTFSRLQVVLLQRGLLLWIGFVVLVPLLLDLFGRQEHIFTTASPDGVKNESQVMNGSNLDLLFLVLVHLSQRQEVLDQKHEVDSAQSRQALPHSVQVFLVLVGVVVMPLREVHPRILVVVMVASLRLKSPQTERHEVNGGSCDTQFEF